MRRIEFAARLGFRHPPDRVGKRRGILRAHDGNPDAAAAAVVPAAARANRAVFYASNGRPRSCAEIRAHFAERIGDGAAPRPSRPIDEPAAVRMAALAIDPDDPVGLGSDPAHPFGTPSASYARMAYMMLAGLGA